MEILEVFLINLFMLGENASNHNNQRIRDTTIIECEGFKFTFKQLNIHLKQSEFIKALLHKPSLGRLFSNIISK